MGEESLLSDSILDSFLNKKFSILDSRFSILDERFSILDTRFSQESRIENRDSQQTVNLLLNGTVFHEK